MTFHEAVRQLAHRDGVECLLSVPGVWEAISECYNNAAIKLMEEENEPEEEEEEEEPIEQGGLPPQTPQKPFYEDEYDDYDWKED